MLFLKQYSENLFIGKLYLYLGQREFISCEGELDDIKGIAFVPEHVGDLKGNNIHSSKKNITFYTL